MSQILLNRNEVLHGPAPACEQVWLHFKREEAALYREGYFTSALIPALSRKFSVPEDHIILGYGSEELLQVVFDTLAPHQDTVLTHAYHYSYYQKYLDFRGVALRTFAMQTRERWYVFDIDDAIRQYHIVQPRVLIINSPNNPTGNTISRRELERLLQTVSSRTLVIVDQAYIEFEVGPQAELFVDLLSVYPNLMLVRSFSKFYALAGFRIAYALCGSGVKSMLNYQNRYLGMNRLIEEVAIAALGARPYYERVAQDIRATRDAFLEQTKNLRHFYTYRSHGNFVLMQVPDVVRSPFNERMDAAPVVIGKYVDVHLYRISIARSEHADALVNTLADVEANLLHQ